MIKRPWEYLAAGEGDEYEDNYDASWALVVPGDLSFEVIPPGDDYSDNPCVCMGIPAYPEWDQSIPDEVLNQWLPPGAEAFELQESMFEIEGVDIDDIRKSLIDGGLVEVQGLNPYG